MQERVWSSVALSYNQFLQFFVHRLPGPFPSVSYWSQPTPPTLDPPWLVSPPHLSRVIARDRGGWGSLSQRFKHPCLLFLISIKPSLWAIQNGSKRGNNACSAKSPTNKLGANALRLVNNFLSGHISNGFHDFWRYFICPEYGFWPLIRIYYIHIITQQRNVQINSSLQPARAPPEETSPS